MLDFVDGWKHLGHTFCATLSNVVSIDVETKRFFSSFNSFFHVFKGASPIVLCCLLLSYSTIFYGCQLWSCNDIELHRLRVAWNDADLGDDAMFILCSLLLDFFLCRIYFGKGNYNFGIDSYDPRIL